MKNVIVTGASKGIGYETALAFARKGYKVLAIARDLDLLNSLLEHSDSGGNIDVLSLDLTKDYSIKEWNVLNKGVDIVVNNAGFLVNKSFADITSADLRKVYEVNVFAPFRLIQQLLPHFNPSAHIINIGSVGGVNGTQKFPGLSAYSSSKAAMSCLAECWQEELQDLGLVFNSLALGAVQTEMLQAAFPDYKAPVSASEMADYIVNFALTAPSVLRGKTILVSRSNP